MKRVLLAIAVLLLGATWSQASPVRQWDAFIHEDGRAKYSKLILKVKIGIDDYFLGKFKCKATKLKAHSNKKSCPSRLKKGKFDVDVGLLFVVGEFWRGRKNFCTFIGVPNSLWSYDFWAIYWCDRGETGEMNAFAF